MCYNGSGNKFNNCKAVGNYANANTVAFGAGFCFMQSEANSSITYCEATSNGSTLGGGYGIKFGVSGDTVSNCVVRNNTLTTNTGGDVQYGFIDFSDDLTSFVANNIAFGHGKVLPVTESGAIVDDGQLNYMFTFTSGTGESAANMITETDISTLTTLSTAGPYNNISIYTS